MKGRAGVFAYDLLVWEPLPIGIPLAVVLYRKKTLPFICLVEPAVRIIVVDDVRAAIDDWFFDWLSGRDEEEEEVWLWSTPLESESF